MKSNVVKGLLLASALCLVGGFASCSGGKTDTPKNGNPGIYDNGYYAYTGFLPGAQEVVVLGADSVVLNQLIDTEGADTYTVTISKGDESKDYTRKTIWDPEETGEYTITLNVQSGKNVGTYTHKIQVVTKRYIELSCFRTSEAYYQKDLQFSEFFKKINLTVTSHGEWTPKMLSVSVDGKKTEFAEDASSYYISSVSDHLFTFAVSTPDGRERTVLVTVNVKWSDEVTDLYLNNLASDAYTIELGGVKSVKINGEEYTKAVISDTEVTFSKADLYKNYVGATFVSLITAEGEYRETINVYKDNYGFESQVNIAPEFIYWWDERKAQGSMSITDQYTTEGDKALKMVSTPSNNPQFAISMDYLQMVFEDESVSTLAFDITYVGTTSAHIYREIVQELADGGTTWARLYSGETQTITITRATYEKYLSGNGYVGQKDLVFTWQNSAKAPGGSERPMYSYLDNFRTERWLKSDALLVEEEATGNYAIALSNVDSVLINGEEIPSDKLVLEDNQVLIDKQWLFSKVGVNTIELFIGGGAYKKEVGVFTKTWDFENGTLPENFIQFPAGLTSNESLTLSDYNDSKVIKATGAHQWQSFALPATYVHLLFADENVDALSFELTVDFEPTTETEVVWLQFGGMGVSNEPFTIGVTKTVKITRSMYETWSATNNSIMMFTWQNQAQNTGKVLLTWYIDNITPVDKVPTDPTLIEDFDDQQIPDFIQFVASSVTQNKYFVDGKSGEDGDKAFVLQNGATSNPQFYFSGAWLDSVFADENVEAFTYDFSISANGDREISASAANSSLYKKYTNHEWTTITFTRAIYNEWKESGQTDLTFTWQNQAKQEGGCGSVSAIFDNFRYVFTAE